MNEGRYAKRRAKLVEDLRTTAEPQTTGTLHRLLVSDIKRPAGYCCLGRACEVAIAGGLFLPRHARGVVEAFGSVVPDGDEGVMPLEVLRYFGFATSDGSFKYHDPARDYALGYVYSSLVSLNDQAHFTFAQIADVIAWEPEGMFHD